MKTRASIVKNVTGSATETRADEQVMKVSAVTIALGSCLIGLWSVASLVSGMIASGGPIAFVKYWFKAVLG
ncbi:hypothetical protein [Desulforhopalus singaporensis]|uniref:Uncharacterized protein n=1 Tax=Desulforhopalus singaporensis TaxID=91360 RepID=A0A1H0N3R6_9BACT|nr:hypothetical protein [Desulforhopalus singaporensis]SDO87364.1 hypothetical protein SAMN05660330_01235 [Desulforhopalus singaporensis]